MAATAHMQDMVFTTASFRVTLNACTNWRRVSADLSVLVPEVGIEPHGALTPPDFESDLTIQEQAKID